MKRLLIIGAGGHGKVVADAAMASGRWQDVSFLDGRYPELSSVLGQLVLGKEDKALELRSDFQDVFVAVGDNLRREDLTNSLVQSGFMLPSIVHPGAWASPSAKLEVGVFVAAGAVVNASALIGKGCIINTGATVDHDCVLGSFVHVSPGAHLGGGVQVGARTWIGIGACIRHDKVVGRDVMVGAGAAVVSDIPDRVQVVGVPARIAAKNS